MSRSNNGVKFVRWPSEEELRNRYREEGIPRLLVVEAGARPPVCVDSGEDWVRAPISRQDLDARVRSLTHWADARNDPLLDSSGTLYFNSQTLILSSTQATLMELFIKRFRCVVYRHELEDQLAACVPNPTRNSLDLQIMRLRRRLASVHLAIRTAWRRGYLLEPESE